MSVRGAALVLSAVVFAALLHVPQLVQHFPFWALKNAAHLADTMFHEMGHSLFAWALGYPSIPSIFTLFGSDQAAGFALTFSHSWPVQIAAWAGMGYGVWWLWRAEFQRWAITAGSVAIALVVISFWRHHTLIISYMGHGSAILMGYYFLYRGLLDLMARHAVERWLNVFLGSFLLISNGVFAWGLAFDAAARHEYSSQLMFGSSHHDFMAMQEEWIRLSVTGIAQGTVVFVVLGVALTLWIAYQHRYDYAD